MIKLKKILFVIESLCDGGAERVLSNITMHFPPDWHIDILVNDESLIKYPYKGNILSLSKPCQKRFIGYIGNILNRLLYLRKLKKNNDYMACISFLDSANISNVLSGNKYCKTIVSIHGDIMAEILFYKFFSRPVARFLYRYADRVIVVSKEIEWKLIHYLKIPSERVKTIENGFDCEWIAEKMNEVPKRGISIDELTDIKQKIVVTVGRLVDVKGQWHLIRAFVNVIKKIEHVTLLIIGDGDLKQYLEAMIIKCNLNKRVTLVGYSDNPFWYLSKADLFVLPSLCEGYPNALAEAICCGVPCIAADVHSGPREILAPVLDNVGERVNDISEEEYGILVPACSGRKYKGNEALEPAEQKMAEAIIMLLSDDKKREYYSQKSLQRSRDLNIKRVIEQWIDVIS